MVCERLRRNCRLRGNRERKRGKRGGSGGKTRDSGDRGRASRENSVSVRGKRRVYV